MVSKSIKGYLSLAVPLPEQEVGAVPLQPGLPVRVPGHGGPAQPLPPLNREESLLQHEIVAEVPRHEHSRHAGPRHRHTRGLQQTVPEVLS